MKYSFLKLESIWFTFDYLTLENNAHKLGTILLNYGCFYLTFKDVFTNMTKHH